MLVPTRVKNLLGEIYGRLVVIGFAGTTKSGGAKWECKCNCGNIVVATSNHLRMKNTKSCGCLNDEVRKALCIERSSRHGHAPRSKHSRAYSVWANMIQRCSNKNCPDYKYYGGRGIVVCERWVVFENFYSDMGDPPSGMSLDRIDVNGDYEPSNCRWATQSQQMRNTRSTRRYDFNGTLMSVVEAAEFYGISENALRLRISKLGYSPSDAVAFVKGVPTKHLIDGELLTMREAADKYGIPYATLKKRVQYKPIQDAVKQPLRKIPNHAIRKTQSISATTHTPV